MLNSSLRDYWTAILYYRQSSPKTKAALLGGFLLHQARHHRSATVRQLLMAFIEKEKETIDGQQSG